MCDCHSVAIACEYICLRVALSEFPLFRRATFDDHLLSQLSESFVPISRSAPARRHRLENNLEKSEIIFKGAGRFDRRTEVIPRIDISRVKAVRSERRGDGRMTHAALPEHFSLLRTLNFILFHSVIFSAAARPPSIPFALFSATVRFDDRNRFSIYRKAFYLMFKQQPKYEFRTQKSW